MFYQWRLNERTAVVIGDVRDCELLQRLLSAYEIDACFHLAAHSIVGSARRAPSITFDVNVRGTWALLEACRIVGGISSIIIASSDKAYGHHTTLPYTEDLLLRPCYPYETSKACADMIAQSFAVTYELPIVVTRCANVYGGGDLNFSRIIPGTIKSALHGERPIIRSDGTPLRDYIYIEDVIAAYLALGKVATQRELMGEAFNVGTGEPISVLELTYEILELCERRDLEPDIRGKGKQLKEIDCQYVSIEKITRIVGWKPNIERRDGLKRTIEWYRKFFGLAPRMAIA
ncbi:MAG TPA: NAD-dependent epimerase/dehydratase family protein [Armatimonadetes bacterium]|nr:NAD-dependent epimerase/dehydratase family protein [Armatimonadota bacterium]